MAFFRVVLPSGTSFNGQNTFTATNIEWPTAQTPEKYIESFSTLRAQKNIVKYTGFQSKIYRLQENSGNDHELDLSIMFVGSLPRWAVRILKNIAIGCLGGGAEIQFYDDFATDTQYRGRWINAADFVDSNEILSGASMNLAVFETQDV